MKELTTEQKAKAYDEAIKVAENIHRFSSDPAEIKRIEQIFPELKESEDEKIRKRIIHALHGDVLDMEETAKAVAWLEKQGEQKPTIIPKFRVGDEIKTSNEESLTITKIDKKGYWSEDLLICNFDEECKWDLVEQKLADKVEPKFHEGDWIVYKDNIWKVCNISLKTYYELLKINNEVSTRHIEDVDKTAHLWTIQDAKDGDVLHSPSHRLIWIYKDNEHYYACVNMNYITENTARNGQIFIPNDACPATKNEQAILFAKMKETGYEWDAEKKELKKIESADKVKPKFKTGDWVVVSTTNGDRVVQIDSVEYSKDGHPSYFTTEGRWFGKGTKARLLTDKDVETIAIPESKLVVNKSEYWSEKDKKMFG